MESAMLKKPLTIFMLLLVAACTARPTPVPTPSANQIDVEEQAVYGALLKQTYSASMFVIMDTTSTGEGEAKISGSTVDYVLQNMHDVDQGTVDSFRARNDAVHPQSPDMDLGIPYVLLSQDQMNEMFSPNQSGWEVFYKNYPDAPGIINFSRVGFNAAFDQALVYIGNQSGWLAGSGLYVLLKKVDGAWTIDQKVITWVS